jgi:autotransporter-associated beta strand protein
MKPSSFARTFLGPLALIPLFSILSTLPVAAAAFSWDGDGANTNWSTGGNWIGGNQPDNDGTAQLVFSHTNVVGSFTSNIDTPYSINSLSVTRTTTTFAFVFTGTTLTFAGSGAAFNYNLSNESSFDRNLILDSNLAMSIFNQTGGDTSNRLTLSGQISGAGKITKYSNNSILRLSGSNTFTGGVEVNRGRLEITNSNAALGTGALTLAAGPGGIDIGMGGQGRTIANQVIVGTAAGSVLAMEGNLTLDGKVTLAGTTADARGLGARGTTILTINGDIEQDLAGGGTTRNLRLTSHSSGGRTVVNGDGSYTGSTFFGVSGTSTPGTVFVNGDLSSSSDSQIYGGMTVRGVGTLKDVTVHEGGILAPGGTVAAPTTLGTLLVDGGVALDGKDDGTNNAVLQYNLQAGGLSDLVEMTGGSLLIGDHVTLSLTISGSLSGTYTLATFDAVAPNSYGTFDQILLNGSAVDWAASGYSVSYGAGSLVLVPEPSAWLLFALGSFVVLFRLRRTSARHAA